MNIEEPEQLLAYLRASRRIDRGEAPRIRVLRGGVSNHTVLVERPSGEAWVLKQALAKLRVREDWFASPLRIHREALGLRYLEQLAPKGTITPLIFEDHQHHLLAIKAVPQPHENWKTLLLSGELEFLHVEQFAQLLAAIQQGACARRAELSQLFADTSFFDTLRIEPYYLYTASQVPEAATFLQQLIGELRTSAFTLVHADYSPKNVLIHDAHLVLLDHEVIHFGDGAFDVGFALTHFLSKAHHLPATRAKFLAAADLFWRTYAERMQGLPQFSAIQSRAARHTLACLLARVSGRSPLEYLCGSAKQRQRQIAIKLMQACPETPPALIAAVGDLL